MLWCEKCKKDRKGEFCNSCGAKLVMKPDFDPQKESAPSAKSRNPLEIATFITACLAAILIATSLFVGSSIHELKIQHDDASTSYEIYAKGIDDGFQSWTACRETTYDISDCDKYRDAANYASEQAAPYFTTMLRTQGEIERRNGYVPLLQSFGVAFLLLAGLLFISRRFRNR